MNLSQSYVKAQSKNVPNYFGARKREWNEEDHPRVPAGNGDESGQFTEKENGSIAYKKKKADLRSKYESVKNIETEILEYGTNKDSGRDFAKVGTVAPRIPIMTDYLILELENKGYSIKDIKRGASQYVEANSNKGFVNETFRVSDHIGRGGIYAPTADFRTFDDIDRYFNGIKVQDGYDIKTFTAGENWEKSSGREILTKTFLRKTKKGKDEYVFTYKIPKFKVIIP